MHVFDASAGIVSCPDLLQHTLSLRCTAGVLSLVDRIANDEHSSNEEYCKTCNYHGRTSFTVSKSHLEFFIDLTVSKRTFWAVLYAFHAEYAFCTVFPFP